MSDILPEMSDNFLDAACRAAGLTWAYRDGAGQWQEAPVESRHAVLAALGFGNADAAPRPRATSRVVTAQEPTPWGADWHLTREDGTKAEGRGPLPPLPAGYHRVLSEGWMVHLLAAPPALPAPPRRWGVTVPLFALWEGRQAGMGSYPMLGDLARMLADQGAAFLGINPVHAGFPTDPDNFSPYAPSHRRRLNTTHIATSAALPETGPLIDHQATIGAQQAGLETDFAAFAGDPVFDAWRDAEGASLQDYVTHQALSEVHGPYWHRWPTEYQDPRSPAVQRFARAQAARLRFHAWAQWMADRQLGAAQARARATGMAFGLYLDLAVGTHPHGAETWAERALFAEGVSLGAPPDLLGPAGQRWGLAPMRPDVLRATGFAAFAQTLRAQFRHAGMVRIDHVLGLERSFWVPEGLPGLYVAMPRDEMLAVLRIEAGRASQSAGHDAGQDAPHGAPPGRPATVIGEDLGTIPDGLREALAASGVLGCRVAMFERDWQGDEAFLPPEDYAPAALASWGTHDLPTWKGWRAGRDIAWRDSLGELADPDTARARRAADIAAFDRCAGGGELMAMHGHLARAGATLVAIQAEDLAGAAEQVNLPGTVHEHPNWARRLPLPLSGLGRAQTLRQTAAVMKDAGRTG